MVKGFRLMVVSLLLMCILPFCVETKFQSSIDDYANPEVDSHPYDPLEASALLDQAGFVQGWTPNPYYNSSRPGSAEFIRTYPSGHPKEGLDLDPLIFYAPATIEYKAWIAQIYKTELDLIGIPVDFRIASGYEIIQKVFLEHDFHLYLGSRLADVNPEYLYDWFHSSMFPDGMNYVGFNNSDYDFWAEKLKYAADITEAVEAAHEAQRILADEVAVIPLFVQCPSKAYMRTCLFGDYAGRPWIGVINETAFGIDGWSTFINIRPENVSTGGELRYGVLGGISKLNPIYSGGTGEWQILDRIFDTLIKRNPYDFSEIPWIASDWSVSSWYNSQTGTNCTKLEFFLRNDIFFHDGYQLTSDDIDFTIGYLKNLNDSVNYQKVRDVHHVETADSFTVSVYMNTTSLWALHWIGELPILPKHIYESILDPHGTYPGNLQPEAVLIGSGSFRLHAIDLGMTIVYLCANRPCQLTEPAIENLMVHTFYTTEQMLSSALAGEIDIIGAPLTKTQADYVESWGYFRVETCGPERRPNTIDINNKRPEQTFPVFPSPTENKDFRDALAHLADKEKIINEVLLGEAVKIDTPVPPLTTYVTLSRAFLNEWLEIPVMINVLEGVDLTDAVKEKIMNWMKGANDILKQANIRLTPACVWRRMSDPDKGEPDGTISADDKTYDKLEPKMEDELNEENYEKIFGAGKGMKILFVNVIAGDTAGECRVLGRCPVVELISLDDWEGEQTIAHEVCHGLGLRDVENETNLMNKELVQTARKLNETQIKIVRRFGEKLAREKIVKKSPPISFWHFSSAVLDGINDTVNEYGLNVTGFDYIDLRSAQLSTYDLSSHVEALIRFNGVPPTDLAMHLNSCITMNTDNNNETGISVGPFVGIDRTITIEAVGPYPFNCSATLTNTLTNTTTILAPPEILTQYFVNGNSIEDNIPLGYIVDLNISTTHLKPLANTVPVGVITQDVDTSTFDMANFTFHTVILPRPQLAVSPTTVRCHQQITINGTRFTPCQNFTVLMDSLEVSNGTTDSTGNFSINFTLPEIPSGHYFLTVVDNAGNYSYSIITIPSGLHDLAVKEIKVSRTVLSDNVVLDINITVENQGQLHESFYIATHANGTKIAECAQNVSYLSTTIVHVAWNCTEWPHGSYTLSVILFPIPREVDFVDNTLAYENILLTVLGDVNGDKVVDITDISMTISAYGKTNISSGWYAPTWYANHDLNNDGIIDITDISLVISQYGNYW